MSIDGKQSPRVVVTVTVSQHARDIANFAVTFLLYFFVLVFLSSFVFFALFPLLYLLLSFYWLDTISKTARARLIYLALPKSHYRHNKYFIFVYSFMES